MGLGASLILERYRQPRRCTKGPRDWVSGSPGKQRYDAIDFTFPPQRTGIRQRRTGFGDAVWGDA